MVWGIPSPRKAPSIYGTIWDILRQNASFFVLTYCSKQVTLQAITSLSMVSIVQEELKKKKEEAEKVQEELKRRKSCPKPPTSPASPHQPSPPPDSVLLLEVWLKKNPFSTPGKEKYGAKPAVYGSGGFTTEARPGRGGKANPCRPGGAEIPAASLPIQAGAVAV